MNLTDKMAYLRGMVDGMELDLTTTKEGKVLGQLLDVMQEMTAYVTDLQTQVDELTEVCDLFDQDLGDLEDIVYDEDDDDDAYYSCDDKLRPRCIGLNPHPAVVSCAENCGTYPQHRCAFGNGSFIISAHAH